ncbi:unnamed protein product, partial [Pylaiella littoralis]
RERERERETFQFLFQREQPQLGTTKVKHHFPSREPVFFYFSGIVLVFIRMRAYRGIMVDDVGVGPRYPPLHLPTDSIPVSHTHGRSCSDIFFFSNERSQEVLTRVVDLMRLNDSMSCVETFYESSCMSNINMYDCCCDNTVRHRSFESGWAGL